MTTSPSFPKFESYPGSFWGVPKAPGAYAPSRNDAPLDVSGFHGIDRLVVLIAPIAARGFFLLQYSVAALICDPLSGDRPCVERPDPPVDTGGRGLAISAIVSSADDHSIN